MDAEIGFSQISPPAFDGENYQMWAVRMEAYLQALDVWEPVEEADFHIPALPENPTLAQLRHHKERKTKKTKAKAILFAAVSSSIFTRIMTLESANAIWNYLRDEYQGNERIKGMKVLNLIKEFEVLKMKESETIKEYSDKLLKIANQEVVAQSTAEAEFVAATAAVNQAIWLKKILSDLQLEQEQGTKILVDNQAAIAISLNPVFHGKTKHFNIKLFFLREVQKNGDVNLVYCKTEDQVADIFTKALSPSRLEKLDCRSKIGIAKSLGTIISIGGAVVVTFYKGPTLFSRHSHIIGEPLQLLHSPQLLWIIGSFFLAAEAFLDSACLIGAIIIMTGFYAVLWGKAEEETTSEVNGAGSSESFSNNVPLLRSRAEGAGPVYVSMFIPLAIVFAVISDVIFLRDLQFLGSYIGAIVIVTGFYVVPWGKTKEQKTSEDNGKSPLLPNKIDEDV
ncbi:hypothetical protein GH714_036499 [Hevea brasiliensis]|uniref:Uncharacterized protein n=1 Tax=Hevea brasiliensis TaxID=3981 RepID=A0A6A6LPP8_HEVBR|nr:hypothetical protein GH714_036499 [Hevea brasiliensis]